MIVRVRVKNTKTGVVRIRYCETSDIGEAAKRVLNTIEDKTSIRHLPAYWDLRITPLADGVPGLQEKDDAKA